MDKFSGNVLLANNEALMEIDAEITGWTECGVDVFNRHKQGEEMPNDYKIMLKLNKVWHCSSKFWQYLSSEKFQNFTATD